MTDKIKANNKRRGRMRMKTSRSRSSYEVAYLLIQAAAISPSLRRHLYLLAQAELARLPSLSQTIG